MIFDSVKNSRLYEGLGKNFKAAFEFINKTDFKKISAGRYDLKNGMYYMVQEYETKPESEGIFEAHKKFIDLQYIVSGRELHNYAHSTALKKKGSYDGEKDLQVYEGKGIGYVLEKEFFAIYFPDDVHMPNLRAGKAADKNIKVVFKIPV